MKVTRVYAGADGESHFEEIDVDIEKLNLGTALFFVTRRLATSMSGTWRPGASM